MVLSDRVERVSLGFHPNVTIVLEHLARHVAGDVHNTLVPRPASSVITVCSNRGIVPSPYALAGVSLSLGA